MASQRLHLAWTILLTFGSGGLFPPIWLLMRRRFLNSLDAHAKVGPVLPVFATVGFALGVVLPRVDPSSGTVQLAQVISFAASITILVLCFRVRRMLEQHFLRHDVQLRLSSVKTFLFGICYLQYKINQAAARYPDTNAIAATFD